MKSHLLSVLLIIFSLTLTACGITSNRGPEHFYFGAYSEAESLYNSGKYEAAIHKYQMYIDENPEGNLAVIAQYYIGKSYVALDQVDKAKGIFKDIIKKNPDLVWANFSKTQLEQLGV